MINSNETKSSFFEFDKIFNSENNKSCLILGPSPNMLNFNFSEFNGKIICIGDSILRGKDFFTADYWIAANNEWPIPDYKPHLKIINSFKNIKFIFSDSALYDGIWTKSDTFLHNNLKVPWTSFDERHHAGKPCKNLSKCCELINSTNSHYTIQEKYYDYFNLNNFKFKKSATVAEYALMIASILGFKNIYLQGIEIPLTSKQYTYYPNNDVDQIIIKTKNYISKEIKKKNIKDGKTFKTKIISIYNRIKNLDPLSPRIKESKIINLFVKIYSLFFKKSVFAREIENIIYNFENMSKFLLINNRKIYNLSKKSNLNSCPSIKYLDPSLVNEDIKN